MNIETALSIYTTSLSLGFLGLIIVLITICRELSDLERCMNKIFIELRFLNNCSSNFGSGFLSLFEKLIKTIVREDAFSKLSDAELDDLSKEIVRTSGRTSQDKSESEDEAVSSKGGDEGASRV